MIVCGSQVLDFLELEKSSRYQDGYEENSETIKHFWQIVHSLSIEEKKKFLSFLTGCDRAPIDGLGNFIFDFIDLYFNFYFSIYNFFSLKEV